MIEEVFKTEEHLTDNRQYLSLEESAAVLC